MANPTLVVLVGDSVQLSGKYLNANSEPTDGLPPTWSSSNATIAYVDTNGLLTAVGPGSATITAAPPGALVPNAMLDVTVAPKAASSMVIVVGNRY